MKRVCLYAAVLALMPVSLFAGSKPQNVTIMQPLMCGSTQLAPGDYKVTWEGTGPIVHVTLASRKTSVHADAKLITKDNSNPGSVVYTTQGSTKILNEIDFRHMSLVLEDNQLASR